jgi:hypothetical protein
MTIVAYFDAFGAVFRLDDVYLEATYKAADPNVVLLQVEDKGQGIQTGLSIKPSYFGSSSLSVQVELVILVCFDSLNR